jgi:hypothetical protein
MNVMIASVAVTEMLPVAVLPYGMRPSSQDEEEQGEPERHVGIPVMADVRQDDLVPEEQDHRLHTGREPLRMPGCARLPRLRSRGAHEQDGRDHRRQQQKHHVFRG